MFLGPATNLLLVITLPTILSQSQTQYTPPGCSPDFDSEQDVGQEVRNNLYSGQQAFTVSLLTAISEATPNENIFFSPHSTFHALLLAYFGSKNKTEEGLKNVLHINHIDSKFKVMNAYRQAERMRLRRNNNTGTEFSSADRIYVSKETQIRECIQDLFPKELVNLDFRNDPDESRVTINKWVETQTKGHIQDILVPGSISSNTKLVLANAAYFKGQWESKFDSAETTQKIFYTPKNQSFVHMMKKNGTFNYAVNERLGVHILELPYLGADDGSDVSMIIMLPPAVNNSLDDLLKRLNPATLQQALSEGMAREVEIEIPKFSFEKTLEFRSILERIGVGNLFTENADLSGFSAETKLVLDDAVHKAKIEVDEEGSTAAAATVLFSFRSSRPLEPAKFICNHPFLFLIYDAKTQAILFAGIYRDPNA